jgi:heparosan-N-sulfate-glucuronate 5-epimerase
MDAASTKRGRLRRWWRPWAGGVNVISTTFSQPLGSNFEPGEISGYYVDLRVKAVQADWPPRWFQGEEQTYWVAVAQFGLGCNERYLSGEGERWLAAAITVGDVLVDAQQRSGPSRGAWLHRFAYPHTFSLPNPWISGIVQGEAASLLVRLAEHTSDDRYAEAAIAALIPMRLSSPAGGVAAELGGGYFPEEYPTDPPSLVLNGGIFALWGLRDVATAYSDDAARELFEAGTTTLATNLDRYDTGYWSRYDLFPHRVVNVASPAYHELHITQLRVMAMLTGSPVFESYADRFEAYERSARNAARAFAHKAVFRLVIPRNARFASRGRARSGAETANGRS